MDFSDMNHFYQNEYFSLLCLFVLLYFTGIEFQISQTKSLDAKKVVVFRKRKIWFFVSFRRE